MVHKARPHVRIAAGLVVAGFVLLVAFSASLSSSIARSSWPKKGGVYIAPSSESAALGQRFVGPVTTKRVKFEKGRTTAVIKGIARTPGTYEYVLRVRSGQVMTVHLTSSNKGVECSIEAPNGDWVEDALGVTDWSGKLAYSGEYKILLTNNKSKRQRNPRYTVEIAIR